ncbi:DMT family transporter [Novosphingobium sp. Gsoil 351]|uniref:DMT family transporter n=1 Tax=Novosphingobium sp. Gsoil 351 TaxID=2675225 RepID=UPI0012B4C7CE|nr:EamA family transporter [Novosphingobium sp. Gsoil 351]QGN54829.1 EamA family transporter [Novosphingobium sp. Gsoil 351]
MTAAPAQAAPHWRPRVVIPFVLLSLIWGSTWLVIRDQLGTVPPGWSVTWRFAIATVAMFALARWRKNPLRLDSRGQLLALLIGAPQFALNFQLVYRAEQHLTSGVVAIVFTLLFAYNAMLGRVFLGRKLSARFLAGSGIAIIGIALLLINETQRAGFAGDNVWLGTAMTLAAILCASSANVLQSTPAAERLPIFTLLAWALLWGALVNGVLAWAISGPPQFEPRLGYALGVAYLALVGSVAAFPLYFRLLRDIGAAQGGYVNVVVPIVAMTLSTLFEGYRWSALAVAGVVVALSGMAVALSARRPST